MHTIQYDNNCELLSEYSSNILKTIFQPLFTSTLKQIISSSIKCYLSSYSFIEDTNTLKLILDININIIYSSKLNTTLLCKSINTTIVDYIYLPKILGGNSVNKSFIQNKLKVEIHNQNVHSSFISSDSIAITMYLVIKLYFPNSEYTAYVLNDGFNDYLTYTSLSRNDLLKKIYHSKFFLKNLKWNPYENSILFLETLDNFSFICLYDFTKKIKKEITNFEIYKKIICFTFAEQPNLIFYNQSYKNNFFYVININTYKIKKLPLEIPSLICDNIHYNQNSKLLYFVIFKNNNCNLCSYDLKNKCTFVFESSNICDFVINNQINKGIVKIIDRSLEKLVLIDLENNSLTNINIEYNYISIKQFVFYKSDRLNNCILILLKLPFEFKLVQYNIDTCMLETIYCNKNINSFEVDSNTNDIIVVIRNNHISELINISFDNSVVLKTPCFIKEICTKNKL